MLVTSAVVQALDRVREVVTGVNTHSNNQHVDKCSRNTVNVQSLCSQHIVNVEVSTHVAPCTLPSLDTAPAPCIGTLPVVVYHL